MPTLDAFINRGVMGNLATLQPILSPMLWNSVATEVRRQAWNSRLHRARPDKSRGSALHQHVVQNQGALECASFGLRIL